jgi:hypothetical protein
MNKRTAAPPMVAASMVKKEGLLAPLPEDSPIHYPMARTMAVDLIINKDSKVWVAHDKPFPGILQWAEYDVDLGTLHFVTDDGKIQDLGMVVQPSLRKYMRMAEKVDTLLVQNEKICDFYSIPLIVRETMM